MRKKRILLYALGKIPAAAYAPPQNLENYKDIDGYEIITFGYHPGVDIKIDFDDDFQEVLKRLPQGWVPDLCLFNHLLVNFLPKGVEKAPFPIVHIAWDWDHHVSMHQTFMQMFDLVIVGGDFARQAVQALGAENVAVLYNGCMMKEFFPAAPKKIRERKYDILFTPCIDDEWHLDRSRWILKLCELTDKYNVYLKSDKPSYQRYLELLQDSKLAFSFHRYGEMSFRVIEAGSQGTIPVDTGTEIGKYLEEDVEFISVNEGNFFEKVDQYLSNQDLLQEMSDKIYLKIKEDFESRKYFTKVLELAGNTLKDKTPTRKFDTLPEEEKFYRRGEICYHTVHRGVSGGTVLANGARLLRMSSKEFEKSFAIKKNPRTMTSLAVANLSLGFMYHREIDELPIEVKRGLFLLKEVITLYPSYAVAHYNLGLVYLYLRKHQEAHDIFAKALELFNDSQSIVDPWCLYNNGINLGPSGFPMTKALDENLLLLCMKQEEKAMANIRHLYQAATLYYISIIEEKNGRIYDSLENLQKSQRLHPTCGKVTMRAAWKLAMLGYKQESLEMYRKAIDLLPFNIDLRLEYIKTLYLSQMDQEVFSEIRSLLKILKRVTSFSIRAFELERVVDDFVRLDKSRSSGYSHDSIRETILRNWIEVLYACLRKTPRDLRLISRIKELWQELGRIDKIFELTEDYINNHISRSSVDNTLIAFLHDLHEFLDRVSNAKAKEHDQKLSRLKRFIDTIRR